MKTKLLFSLLLFSSFAFAEVIDRIVAVVNNEIVTLSDLRSFSGKLEKSGLVDDLLLFGQKPESLKGNQKAQLDYLMNERILDSEIKRLNLAVTIERVEQEIRDIAKKNGVSRNELMTAIKSQGMSPSDYQAFIKTRIERQSLIEQEITSKIRVSDEDVQAQYSQGTGGSEALAFEYTLAHIFFNPKKGGAGATTERAEAALKKLKEGAPFEAVAEQSSEDPNFSNGGVLGTFRSGEFNSELEKAVQNLNAGSYTGIVTAKDGLHIFKVVGKKMTTDPKFEKEKEKIRAQLFEKAFQKHFKNWLDNKRDESFVRINQ